jgi:hypothetical protein
MRIVLAAIRLLVEQREEDRRRKEGREPIDMYLGCGSPA